MLTQEPALFAGLRAALRFIQNATVSGEPRGRASGRESGRVSSRRSSHDYGDEDAVDVVKVKAGIDTAARRMHLLEQEP